MSHRALSAPLRALRGTRLQQTATRCASTKTPAPPKPIDDSTSALDYKLHKHGRRLPHLVTQHPRSPSAEEAVTNILYNTPPPSTEPFKRHRLNCLVQNEPGVLSRVSGILAGRGFNIDSLVVCQTEIRDLSRMCIILKGQDGVVEQARRQLEDLVPVWAVLDYTKTSCVERELLLAKVSILGPEFAEAQLSGPIPDTSFEHAVENQSPENPPSFVAQGETQGDDKIQRELALARSFESAGQPAPARALYPNRSGTGQDMSASEALIAKNLHLSAIKTLADQFGGRVVDVAENSCIVELTAKSSRVDSFLSLMRPFGVLEAARSGVMVLPRTPIPRYSEEDELAAEKEEIDVSLLPPG
ncbi:acetolactate synthase, small subunit [Cryptococcus neoformans]|nr:acetolactate synthase, small subunit [Cryptococcus neoformans var. grubii AD2-60a]OWZ27816.1 acetolactate synthase, small subunit [Cryptococcus neoformans var. grubii AD1-83a]OWZ38846.1 acetolactate synthase, small subunit [Cryptococcus neoformans var. grubii C23]OXB33818.1 acetolactate synthase, small subunit [Cryptococcus neoformans var. grubii]OXC57917.1 acetolactate synthase, small subunit [Cryptococcus neoformans var. grubii MW-RSA852]OXC81243.1 acetolactate synthase, small subunit [Cr